MSTSASKITVVVVDDYAFFRDGMIRGLTRTGQIDVVGEAANGREALEVIARERPAVAVADYQMPDIDGLGLVHAVSSSTRVGSPSRTLPGHAMAAAHATAAALGPEGDHAVGSPGVLSGD